MAHCTVLFFLVITCRGKLGQGSLFISKDATIAPFKLPKMKKKT